jgi:hypothetical protein
MIILIPVWGPKDSTTGQENKGLFVIYQLMTMCHSRIRLTMLKNIWKSILKHLDKVVISISIIMVMEPKLLMVIKLQLVNGSLLTKLFQSLIGLKGSTHLDLVNSSSGQTVVLPKANIMQFYNGFRKETHLTTSELFTLLLLLLRMKHLKLIWS